MKAIVFDKKPVLRRNHPEPTTRRGDVLIQVLKAGVCTTDLEVAKGYMGFKGVMGHEFVGRVVKGPRAMQGRRVVAEINCVCGKCDMCQSGLSAHCRNRTTLGIDGHDGCFAELIVVPQRNCHLVPDTVSDEEAVFVEPLAAAYQVLRQLPVESHMKIVVLGAGRLGNLVAQVLGQANCKLEVLDVDPERLTFCEKKGIQARPLADVTARADRDVVVDCTGASAGLATAMKLVRPRGTIVLKSTVADPEPVDLSPLVVSEVTVLGSRCGPFADALRALARKQVDVLGMVTRRFTINKALDALRLAADSGQLKVIIDVGE